MFLQMDTSHRSGCPLAGDCAVMSPWDATLRPDVPPPIPTKIRLKSMGADKFRVTCARAFCLHSAFVSFAVAGVEDQAPFPSIAERRRFVCTSCGGRR